MESPEWPPQYDERYLPASDRRYWFPDREAMDPEARAALILRKLRAQME